MKWRPYFFPGRNQDEREWPRLLPADVLGDGHRRQEDGGRASDSHFCRHRSRQWGRADTRGSPEYDAGRQARLRRPAAGAASQGGVRTGGSSVRDLWSML